MDVAWKVPLFRHVHRVAVFRTFLRYNNYENDPLSKCAACEPMYNAENALSARSDLNPSVGRYPFFEMGKRPHGGTDAKLVRHQNHIRNDNITAVFGRPFSGRRQEFPAQVSATDSSNDGDSTPTTQGAPADASNAASERHYPQRQRRALDRFVP
ncbi:hypothetical protein MTO96_020411 [Rhipicephalus appendiculatus]